MKRILFCGTPSFAISSLKALAQDSFFEVALVLTQPDRPSGRGHKLRPSPIKQCAQDLGIDVLSPESVNTDEFLETLRSYNFDACVVVAFGQILKQSFLDLFAGACVNVHGSLLPAWRGAAPIQRSLMAGDTRSGVSLQQVVRRLDAGPVIGERTLTMPMTMNAIELHDQLSPLGAELLTNEFKKYLLGELSPQEQDDSLVTYAHKITKEEAKIDWSGSAIEVHNHVRGLAMGPQARFILHGKTYKVHQTQVVEGAGQPGEVLACKQEELVIACGDQALSILTIQPESKPKMAVSDFLRGQSLSQGEMCNVSST